MLALSSRPSTPTNENAVNHNDTSKPLPADPRPGTSGTELNLRSKRKAASAEYQRTKKAEADYRAHRLAIAARKDWSDARAHFATSGKGVTDGLKCIGRILKAVPAVVKEKSEGMKEKETEKNKAKNEEKKKKLEEKIKAEEEKAKKKEAKKGEAAKKEGEAAEATPTTAG